MKKIIAKIKEFKKEILIFSLLLAVVVIICKLCGADNLCTVIITILAIPCILVQGGDIYWLV